MLQISARKMLVLGITILAPACSAAAPTETDSPDVDVDVLESEGIVTSTNADGTWTADAYRPFHQTIVQGQALVGGAKFTGPAGKTRRMGVCLLTFNANGYGALTPCNDVAQCSSAPTLLPPGGYRYCVTDSGTSTGQKYCAYRPGTQRDYCAGTPANGGQPIPPDTLRLTAPEPPVNGSRWISYACFEGCTVTDPSSSSAGTAVVYQPCGTRKSCPD
jgi:hypothetical protein